MLGPIGKNQIVIGAAQFAVGQSTTDYTDDGALGVDSYGLNPFVIPGAMYSLAAATAHSTAPVDNIIGACAGYASGDSNPAYLVGDAGNLYAFGGTTLTKEYTDSTATYQAGVTDIVPFNAYFFVTSTSYLGQWNGGGTYTYNYKTLAASAAPHPMLVYSSQLYVADGNLLKALNTSGTLSTVLTLTPQEQIYALGIDPLTGLMLISTQRTFDGSDTLGAQKFISLYDGVSTAVTRRIPIDDLVVSFTNYQGQVVCGIGYGLGIWNGLGVTYLRRLMNANPQNGYTDMPYKHHVKAIGTQLHIIDGAKVLTYGPVKAGQMGFFYTAYEQTNTPPSDHLTCLFNAGVSTGANRLGYTYYDGTTTDYYFYTVDFGSTAAGLGILTTNNIYFPRPVNIREIVVITTPQTTGTTGTCTFTDENGNTLTAQSFVTASAESPKSTFNFNFSGYQCYMVRPQIDFAAQGFGIIKMMIYYDVAI